MTDAEIQNDGQYTVEAMNAAGVVSHDVELTGKHITHVVTKFTHPFAFYTRPSTIDCIVILSFVVNEAPFFTLTPDNKEVKEGGKVVFKCKAHGKPVPEITWSKGEQLLVGDDDVSIETVVNEDKYDAESTFTINSTALVDDSEMYLIQAVNSCGEATHTFGLTG